MADLLSDGNTRVSWVPSIANIAAPTVAELNAGTRLDEYMPPDGLNMAHDEAAVNTAKLSSTFDSELPGRSKVSPSLTLIRQTPTDTPWNLLTRGTTGYVVVRDTVAASTAWTAAQKCRVYPSTCGLRQPLPPAANEVSKFTVRMYVSVTHDDNATVA